jgi:hypothetical protein
MQEIFQPLLHKSRLVGLAVHVQRSGLCLGDTAELGWLADRGIGVFALPRARRFGIFARKRPVLLGQLDAEGAAIVAPALLAEEPLRVRIVGLNPEHLAGEAPPEIHVSIWGDARRVQRITPANGPVFEPPPAFSSRQTSGKSQLARS